jgi:hypothetical protein
MSGPINIQINSRSRFSDTEDDRKGQKGHVSKEILEKYVFST